MGFFGVLSFLIVCIFQICNVHARSFENETIGNENRLEKYEQRGGQCKTESDCGVKGGTCKKNRKGSCNGDYRDWCNEKGHACKLCCIPKDSKMTGIDTGGNTCKKPIGQCLIMGGTCQKNSEDCANDKLMPDGCSNDCKCCITNTYCFREGTQCLTFSAEIEKKDWVKAKEACVDTGGRLATIDHPNEVYDFLSENYKDEVFWIGGSDKDNEGTWEWADGQELDPHFPWKSWQIDSGTETNCLFVSGGYGYVGGDCNQNARYICQKQPPCVDFGSQCLTFHDWRTDKLSWKGAEKACRTRGARLAKLDQPQAVQEYVNGLFNQGTRFWVGATDAAVEGNWVWTDTAGQSLDIKFPWASNKPPKCAPECDCMFLEPTKGYRSDKCYVSYQYICENV